MRNSDQTNAPVCNCADTPPTMPTCRGEHLPSCPMFLYSYVLKMQARNEDQRRRSVCPPPVTIHGRQFPDVEAAVLGAEAVTLAHIRAVIEANHAA